jgi:peptide/nickel transport system substrate-binding protein
MRPRAFVLAVVIASVLAAGCSPGASQRGSEPSSPGQSAAKKRLTAGMFSDPAGLHLEMTNPGGSTGSAPGLGELYQLVHAGASFYDDAEVLQPRLAERVPSAENGDWKISPDGRMETAWTLRNGVTWQDGTPLTAADFVFTIQVNQDKEIGIVNPAALDLVETVEAPDPRRVVVRWKSPFIEADQIFIPGLAMPLPKHLLEEPFKEDKARFLSLPYWRDAFVGAGPYRIQGWHPGSHVVLTANDAYLLGRPKIDEIEIRFISDLNAVIANLLSGAIEKPIGRGLRIEHVLQIRDMTDQIRVAVGDTKGGVLPMYPQFIDTNPTIIKNAEFRKALMTAIDRKEMDDTINFGLGGIADSWLQPDKPEYAAVKDRIVRYPLDPRRATEMIQTLGYAKGGDGVFRDAAGDKLSLQVRTTEQNTIQARAIFPLVDYWKRIGIDAESLIVPNQLISDREYRSQFPGFELVSSGQTVKSSSIRQFHSTSAPLPTNRFQGSNRARYQNPEFDALIDKYVVTIPTGQRMSILGDIINLQTDLLTTFPLFYQGEGSVLGAARLKNSTGSKMWNVHLWDVA